jgi:hypothetical protein
MGTRSLIAYQETTGDPIVAAYCHWDGYPSHNGKILLENYTTFEAAKALVDGGDMSTLGAKCYRPEGHTFDNPVDGFTVYYDRDRGETDADPEEFDDVSDLDGRGAEYVYLFRGDKWMLRDPRNDEKWLVLTPKLCVERD